ncbi:MAG: ABC transporter permease, partial [Nitrospirota bacterium]
METILSGIIHAFSLILSFDRELYNIVFLSLKVSGSALLLATFIGLPIGSAIGLRKFLGRDFIISLLNTFMGLPPVVVGLVLYLILSRSGPLGFLGILYSPFAMIIAQTLLAAPIIAALSHSSIIGVDDVVKKSAITLGATPLQAAVKVIAEARYGIMAAIIAGFGRAIAEVGAILIVG